jgi:hypothetical protein
LEVDASRIPLWYPAKGTQEFAESLHSCPYVIVTLSDPPFQESSGSRERDKGALITPHLQPLSRLDSVCLVLLSLAVTNRISCLISFPAGTKMFQFPAFPIMTDLNRSLIEGSPVQSLHAACRGIVLLVTPFFSS